MMGCQHYPFFTSLRTPDEFNLVAGFDPCLFKSVKIVSSRKQHFHIKMIAKQGFQLLMTSEESNCVSDTVLLTPNSTAPLL